MGSAEVIKAVSRMYEKGLLTSREYERAKARVLREHEGGAMGKSIPPLPPSRTQRGAAPQGGPGMDAGLTEDQGAALIHFGVLAGLIVPVLGLAVPIVL